jgi:dTDP-D-glucose 4,6-dehydratase
MPWGVTFNEKDEYRNLAIIKTWVGRWKKREQKIEYIEDRPFNDERYYISNEKIKKLGWSININLMEGIDELIITR